MLVQNRSLPLVNPCLYLSIGRGSNKCELFTKRTANFLEILGEHAYEVVTSHEYRTAEWPD